MLVPNMLSKKCRYALRAIFELALRDSSEPVKVHDIASAQAIPPRFLEVILAELKNAGFVESRRGNDGGYFLARSADNLTVGEVINFLRGNSGRLKRSGRKDNDLVGNYAFAKMWQDLNTAMLSIYNGTTFADLVERELAERGRYVPDYRI